MWNKKNQLKDIIYDFELFDVFRYIEPNLNSYTWHRKNIACRLDRIYLSNFNFQYPWPFFTLILFINETNTPSWPEKANGISLQFLTKYFKQLDRYILSNLQAIFLLCLL
jgi:hypothetical protein